MTTQTPKAITVNEDKFTINGETLTCNEWWNRLEAAGRARPTFPDSGICDEANPPLHPVSPSQFTLNFQSGGGFFTRDAFNQFSRILDPYGRDLYRDCGYPQFITSYMYRAMYDREPVAKRLVEIMPEDAMAAPPTITEDLDPKVTTKFEGAVDELDTRFGVNSIIKRAVILSRIGSFGILLIGIADGKSLREPAAGVIPQPIEQYTDSDMVADIPANDPTRGFYPDSEPGEETVPEEPDGPVEPLYFRAFDETQVQIIQWEYDPKSWRYGQPVMYLIRFVDYSTVPVGQAVGGGITQAVHWTRVIHIPAERKSGEIFGMSAMQSPWNRLLDLRKITGGSAEMLWKGGFPGYAYEVNPELGETEIDVDKFKRNIEEFTEGLKRYQIVAGMTIKSLHPQAVDPSPHVDVQMKQIAMAAKCPLRIFMGSESAQMASDQEGRNWIARLRGYQVGDLNPLVFRPFYNRLIQMKVLPEPATKIEAKSLKQRPGVGPVSYGFMIAWKDLENPSDRDRAGVALALTQALAAYVQGGCAGYIPPMEYFTLVWQFPINVAKQLTESADAYFKKGVNMALLPPDPMATPGAGTDPQQSDGRGTGDSPIRGGIGHGTAVD